MTPDVPTTAEAVAASVAVARELGLPADDPHVVAEGYSVRVLLRPAPVLTRVVTVGIVLRGDPLPWMTKELAVCQHLAAAGSAVAPPWESPGPHTAHGLPVTLWRWVPATGEAVGQAEYGRLLGALHHDLASYAGDLPLLAGPLTDIATGLTASDDPVLHEVAGQLLPLAQTWPRRPLHGDSHTGNVMVTADGPLWIDFEDACVGPVEWDLASTTLTDEAVTAYPGDVDAERLRDCRDLRRLQILASALTDDLRDPGTYEALVGHLRHRL